MAGDARLIAAVCVALAAAITHMTRLFIVVVVFIMIGAMQFLRLSQRRRSDG